MTLSSDVRGSYARLAHAQKPAEGVPFYMRAVNRRAGRLIAAFAARFGAAPDQVTAASALCCLAGMGLLVGPEPSIPVAVAIVLLLQLGFAFDSADGQLARLTGTGSRAGEWLDHVVDATRLLLLHLTVAVALFLHAGVGSAWLLVPLAFAVIASVRFFAQMLADQLGPPARSSVGRRAAWIQAPADAGVVNAVFLLWPWTPAFIAAYTMLAAANLLLLLATLHRRRRALTAAVP